MVALKTTTNAGQTTFVACGGSSTVSTITPSLNPTPTQPVTCKPIYGGKPITDEDKIVKILSPNVRSYCNGTTADWGVEGGDSSAPSGNNHIESGYTVRPGAPDDCNQFYKGNLTPLQVDLCAAPLQAIMDACPYDGGRVETVCGTSWLVSCILGGRCIKP